MKATVIEIITKNSEGEIRRCPECPLCTFEHEYGIHMCDLIEDLWHEVPALSIDKDCPLKGFRNPIVYIENGKVKAIEERKE